MIIAWEIETEATKSEGACARQKEEHGGARRPGRPGACSFRPHPRALSDDAAGASVHRPLDVLTHVVVYAIIREWEVSDRDPFWNVRQRGQQRIESGTGPPRSLNAAQTLNVPAESACFIVGNTIAVHHDGLIKCSELLIPLLVFLTRPSQDTGAGVKSTKKNHTTISTSLVGC